jgi:hypothetical protein
MALWTEFPSELPVSKLSLVLDVWRGNPVDPREAALAVLNVIGYAVGHGLVSAATVFGAAPPAAAPPMESPAAVENAFAAVLVQPMAAGPASASGEAAAHGQSTPAPVAAMVAFDDTKKIPWQTILSVAIPILRKLILGF